MRLRKLFFHFCVVHGQKRPRPRAEVGYFPQIDGIPCDTDEWVPGAVEFPIMITPQGNIRGSHRCKLNRRYADPKVLDGMGPKHFEGDSFYHVPYAKHIRRFDYGNVDYFYILNYILILRNNSFFNL